MICRSGMEPGATAEPLDFRVGGGGRPAKAERANAAMRRGNASRSCPCHAARAKDRDPQGRDALALLGWRPLAAGTRAWSRLAGTRPDGSAKAIHQSRKTASSWPCDNRPIGRAGGKRRRKRIAARDPLLVRAGRPAGALRSMLVGPGWCGGTRSNRPDRCRGPARDGMWCRPPRSRRPR